MPPARFSPLAVTKSMPRSPRRSGQQRARRRRRPGLPMTSPIIRTRQAPARRVRVASPRGAGHARYFAYSTARVSRITVTLIWPG